MAAKKVASALDILTSDGLVSCEEQSNHISCAAFVADYSPPEVTTVLKNLIMMTQVIYCDNAQKSRTLNL